MMAEMDQMIGYAQDLSNARKQVNDALKSFLVESNQRLRAASMIVDNPQCVDLFFSLFEEDKVGEGVLALVTPTLSSSNRRKNASTHCGLSIID